MPTVIQNRRNEWGASMVEMALAISLIAVITIISVRQVGHRTSCQYRTIGNHLDLESLRGGLPGQGGTDGYGGVIPLDCVR